VSHAFDIDTRVEPVADGAFRALIMPSG